MIQSVIVIKGGAIADVYMQDDNDDIYIVDLDVLAIGMCPMCSEGLAFGVCPECEIEWEDVDTSDVANKLLHERAAELMREALDEQFVEDDKSQSKMFEEVNE